MIGTVMKQNLRLKKQKDPCFIVHRTDQILNGLKTTPALQTRKVIRVTKNSG